MANASSSLGAKLNRVYKKYKEKANGDIPTGISSAVVYITKENSHMVEGWDGTNRYSSDDKKSFLREFTFTQQDYFFRSVNSKDGDTLIKELLDQLFRISYKHSDEVRLRYSEMVSISKRFKEYRPHVYIGVINQWVYVARTALGDVVKFKLRYDLDRVVAEGDDIWVLYKNGEDDLIMEYGEWSDQLVRAETKLGKGYNRVRFGVRENGSSEVMRTHMFFILLVFGVGMAKHLLGRDSYLTVDHIDGDGFNNRFDNLRVITRTDNTLYKTNKNHLPLDFLTIPTLPSKELKSVNGNVIRSMDYLYC